MAWVRIGNELINLDWVALIQDVPNPPPDEQGVATAPYLVIHLRGAFQKEAPMICFGDDARAVRAALAAIPVVAETDVQMDRMSPGSY